MNPALRPFLLFIGLAALLGGGFFVFKNFKTVVPNASLLIDTPDATVEAFIDDQSLGQTPLKKDGLSEGDYTLKLISGEQVYQTNLELLGGTQTVVRRQFGPSETFSSGEVLWFERSGQSASVSITSEPDGVRVKLDGKDRGQTPVLIEDLESGPHDLHLSLENFETRRSTIRVEDGYQLRLSSQLAFNPLPSAELKKIDFGDEKTTVYNLSPTDTLFVDSASLTRGIIYWAKTRGLGTAQAKLDYFVDAEGNLFDSEGQSFDPQTFDGEPVETAAVGFLGLSGDEDLSDQARTALISLTKKILKTPPLIDKAKIMPTGLGWLRVRSEPNLSGSEIARVNVGEKFELLEEKTGWAKIKLEDNQTGWVSADFIEKLQEAP